VLPSDSAPEAKASEGEHLVVTRSPIEKSGGAPWASVVKVLVAARSTLED
jgi:hypothetical protein